MAHLVSFAVSVAVIGILWLSVMRPAMGNIVLWSSIVLGALVLTGFALWGAIS